jgi:hypothetical protein
MLSINELVVQAAASVSTNEEIMTMSLRLIVTLTDSGKADEVDD